MNGSSEKFKRAYMYKYKNFEIVKILSSPGGALVYKVGVSIKTVLLRFFRFPFFSSQTTEIYFIKNSPSL